MRPTRLRSSILLGLLQGPTEMAPVSSSAHTALAQQMLNRSGGGRRGGTSGGAESRKRMEVALHGGSAGALAIAMRRRLARSWARLGGRQTRRRVGVMALSAAPPALAGYLLEGPVQRRLGGPRSIAAGLVAGAGAMALADRRPRERTLEQAGAADGLALGLAQAAALAPGVSRRGATLAAARMRRFSRADADELSWLSALPVILGACALKGRRAAQDGLPGSERGPLALGGAAAAASTLLSAAALGHTRGRGGRALAPYCAYRAALALVIIRSMRDTGSAGVQSTVSEGSIAARPRLGRACAGQGETAAKSL